MVLKTEYMVSHVNLLWNNTVKQLNYYNASYHILFYGNFYCRILADLFYYLVLKTDILLIIE